MSSTLQRVCMAVAAAAAALAFAAPSAHAVPEASVREESRQLEAIELARQVAERQQRLAALNRQADARDRALVGRKELLARYGYRGDPDAVRVVLPMASYDVSAGFGLTGPSKRIGKPHMPVLARFGVTPLAWRLGFLYAALFLVFFLGGFFTYGEEGEEIRAAAQRYGMKTLREIGVEKIKSGVTTPEELVRVTQETGE